MKNKKKIVLLSFIILLAAFPVNIALGTTLVYNDSIEVYIQINDAYYCALDTDNQEDDIVSDFYLDVVKVCPFCPTQKYEFYLLVELIMPSGEVHSYLFKVTCYPNVYSNPTLYLDNHATELGWYTIQITALLPYGYNTYIYGTEVFDFDPPGTTPPTDPPGCRILIN